MVGMNWPCLFFVVTCTKIVDITLPEPVSAMAVNVVGPAGLMSGCVLSVTLPDLPVVRFTQVTFNGSFCTSAGPRGPAAGDTEGGWPGVGAGGGGLGGAP